ncbi:MAG: diaminopimelate epimerase [Candidatus Altiarchaeota archaeon]|nr:diaminopimelate epimerase [Candidatus Altiarchaeota archaeon]
MDVKFTKMHGAGNDFVVLDEWRGVVVPENLRESLVRSVCDRHFGVGGDGAIFVRKSGKADASFVFYNPDGSRAEMCGNGIRCLAKFLYDRGLVKKKSLKVESLAGIKELELVVKAGKVVEVKVGMGRPQVTRGEAQVSLGNPAEPMVNERILINGRQYNVTAVGMGNPHAIVFVEDVENVDVRSDGAAIRNHLAVWPRGVNAHFVQQVGVNEFKIRTFERGVEDETLACGTGICASAVASVLNGKADPSRQILLHARGGDVKVDLESKGKEISRVYMTGPAEEVFEGVFNFRK